VDGTVALSGDQVRVVVDLFTSGGERFGRTQVTGTRTELFQLQEELAHEVAVFLREQLGESVEILERRAGTEDVEAWQLMQRARALTDQADLLADAGDTEGARERLAAADTLLAQAEEEAPEWLEPTVRRGWAAYQFSRWTAPVDITEGEEWIDQGMFHAQVALALDSLDADALELRGTLKYWKWLLDLEPNAARAEALFDGAEADLMKATLENPNQAGAFATLSHLVLNKGATAEAKVLASRAYEADAYLRTADQVLWRLFLASYDLEDLPEANRWCLELGRRYPGDDRYADCRLWTMTMYGAEVEVDRAWTLVDEYVQLSPPQMEEFRRRWAGMALAAILAGEGLADSARAVANRSQGSAAIDPARDLLYLEAFVRTILGDNEEALDLLTEYVAVVGEGEGDGLDYWWFDDLREEPRYQMLRGTGGG